MNNIKKVILPILIFSIVWVSCSDPMDKPYNKDRLEKDLIEIKQSISDEDLKLLTEYIFFKSVSKSKMIGLTYSDLLKNAKELVNSPEAKEYKENAAKVISKEKFKENGYFWFDYKYNMELKRKVRSPVNFLLSEDGKKLTVIEHNDSTNDIETKQYKIIEEIESTVSIYKVKLLSENSAIDKEEYELTLEQDLARMIKLSNNDKWYYITKNSRNAFEYILEEAGLNFHK